MGKSTALNFTQTIHTGTAGATGAAKVALFVATTNDSVIKSISAATDDTVAVNLQIFLKRSGGSDSLVGTVPVPASSGNLGTAPAVDILNPSYLPWLPLDNVGKCYIPLAVGDTIDVAAIATLSGGKTCFVNAFGEDY